MADRGAQWELILVFKVVFGLFPTCRGEVPGKSQALSYQNHYPNRPGSGPKVRYH